MQDPMLTVRNILQNNWVLASPYQYPPLVDADTNAKRTGVSVETGMPKDIRARLMICVEVKASPTPVRQISDEWWQYEDSVDITVWNRAQTRNMTAIEKAKADRMIVVDEIEKIIHDNQFNALLEDDLGTHIPSWMWLERETPEDELDSVGEGEYPMIYNRLSVHIMYLRQQGHEQVIPEFPVAVWDNFNWDDGAYWG